LTGALDSAAAQGTATLLAGLAVALPRGVSRDKAVDSMTKSAYSD
jgi:hypothetical protein